MTVKPLFMPAPRPANRVSPDEARRLIADTADLGFARQSREAAPSEKPEPAPAPTKKAPAAEAYNGQTLRFDVPESVWRALKIESVNRRVTVKYLVLEALLKAGYPVDLEAIPEDGRRLR